MSWSTPKDVADRYSAIVKQCLTDDEVFKNFKSNIDFISIVGTPQPYQLSHFMDKINKFPDILKKLNEFRRNDLYGTPPHIQFNGLNLSMGTIRYIFSLCYLKEHFGILDNMTISEMGVGYGGLAFTIGTYYKPSNYYLIDLPEVQQLALKYLTKLGIKASAESPPEKVDLFISEFCLSKFDDEDLYAFYEKYIQNASNVFLTMNLIDEERKQKFIRKMNEDFSMKIYPETHGTEYPAYVIIGKK